MEFREFLEQQQDQLLTKILISENLLSTGLLRQAIVEKNSEDSKCPLGQFLIRKRYIKMNDYTKIMLEVRKQAEKIFEQQGGKVFDETSANTLRYVSNQQSNSNIKSDIPTAQTNRPTRTKIPPREEAVKQSKENNGSIKKSATEDAPTQVKSNVESCQIKDFQSNRSLRGARLGSYEILEEVARGGMGIVYKARQVYMNRIVALKVLLAGGAAKETEIQRFRREAESAGSLQHPNIVSIYEVGEENGIHYFTMDFLEGETLQVLMKKRTVRLKTMLKVLVKVALALEHAHQNNVIHRDIKPSNIIVSEEGEPKLMDFGLAKKQDIGEALTEKGSTLGTPYYMAPEQIMNKEADHRVDIYSMGVILYEMLAHRLPFSATTLVELYQKVMNEDPILPSKFNRKVNSAIMAVCLKAISKNPNSRYSTAKEFAEDLERYINDEPVLATLPNFFQRMNSKIRRLGAKAWIIFGMLFLFVVAGIVVLLQYWAATPQMQKKIEIEILIKEGENLLERGEYPRALAKFQEVLQMNSESKEAYLGCGHANLKAKKSQEAIWQYNEAIRLDGNMLEAYLGRSKAFQEQKEWDKAISDLQWVIKKYQETQQFFKLLEAYLTLGQIYEQKKSVDSIPNAFEAYQRMEDVKKKILLEADGYIKKQQFDKAIQCYDGILKIIPKDVDALQGRQKIKKSTK